jgi:hypothetical protein
MRESLYSGFHRRFQILKIRGGYAGPPQRSGTPAGTT